MSEGDRIAKVLSRAGVASRRGAEAMIAAGRVAVNGRVIDSPALNVTAADRVTVDGAPLPEADRPRLWLYHKPAGLVTTARDEKGRDTVFDALPEGMPRVMSVGRLDLTSEGLLLLTNDGGLKRRLELPATGWVRKYRVRIKGTPAESDFDPLRAGITVAAERFQPMSVTLDRQQGANAWVTVGLREGKNREIRRAMAEIGFEVNRLIRVAYGPFRLGALKPGAVEEVKARVLADQLGLTELVAGHAQAAARPGKPRGRAGAGAPGPACKAGGVKAGGVKAGARAGGKPGAKPEGKAAPRGVPAGGTFAKGTETGRAQGTAAKGTARGRPGAAVRRPDPDAPPRPTSPAGRRRR